MAVKLSFLLIVIDQLLHVAFPFAYKRIVISLLPQALILYIILAIWLVALSLSVYTAVNQTLLYHPSLEECLIVNTQVPIFLII